MLTQEEKEKNYNLFISKLSACGIDTSKFDSIKDKLMNATYSSSNENGMAYDGALIDIILRILTPFAVKVNETFSDEMKVDKCTLVKVCLLHQLAKSQMFEPNDVVWEVEKRNLFYKYAASDDALKCGIKSLLLAQSLGINFTNIEVEAMTIMDRPYEDRQAMLFASPLSTLVKIANELTYLKKRLTK